jgi:hypothetical protein
MLNLMLGGHGSAHRSAATSSGQGMADAPPIGIAPLYGVARRCQHN